MANCAPLNSQNFDTCRIHNCNDLTKLTPIKALTYERHRDARTISSALLKNPLLFAPIPGRPRASKPVEITSLMPHHPNMRDYGKNSDPPRARQHAPPPAEEPLLGKPSHLDQQDTVTHIIVGVQGHDYVLQEPSDIYILLATQRAITYARHLFRHNIPAAEPRNLTDALAQLRIKYSRAKAERLAIADANKFQFTPAQTHRDIQELRCLGSIEALIVTDIRSLPFSYPKMYAFLPSFFS